MCSVELSIHLIFQGKQMSHFIYESAMKRRIQAKYSFKYVNGTYKTSAYEKKMSIG